MRTYIVRVFIPTLIAIVAEDEAQALEKVGAYYQERYAKDIREWLEPLPEPEDAA